MPDQVRHDDVGSTVKITVTPALSRGPNPRYFKQAQRVLQCAVALDTGSGLLARFLSRFIAALSADH